MGSLNLFSEMINECGASFKAIDQNLMMMWLAFIYWDATIMLLANASIDFPYRNLIISFNLSLGSWYIIGTKIVENGLRIKITTSRYLEKTKWSNQWQVSTECRYIFNKKRPLNEHVRWIQSALGLSIFFPYICNWSQLKSRLQSLRQWVLYILIR